MAAGAYLGRRLDHPDLVERQLVGDAGRSVSLEHYGASATGEILFEEFGITAAAVVAAARESIAAAAGDQL